MSNSNNVVLERHLDSLAAAISAEITIHSGSGGGESYSVFTGATSIAGGASGLVPEPSAGDEKKFLRGDGTWGIPANTGAGIALDSVSSGVEGALWKNNVDGYPMLTLRHGTGEYNFLYDEMTYVGGASSALESVSPDTYILGTASVSTEGGVWYEIVNDIPKLCYHSGRYNYALNYDTMKYVGDPPGLISYLPFDVSATLDACGKEWAVSDTRTASIGSANALKGNAFQFSSNGHLYTTTPITFGGTDFTIRFHCYISSSSATYANLLVAKPTSGGNEYKSYLGIYRSGQAFKVGYFNSAGTNVFEETIMASPFNALHHVEIDYLQATSTLKVFVDGQLATTGNVSIERLARYFSLGSDFGKSDSYSVGTIDEFQIYDGTALHSADFTPPTAADYA